VKNYIGVKRVSSEIQDKLYKSAGRRSIKNKNLWLWTTNWIL